MASYLKDVKKTDAGYKYDYVNNFNGLSSKYVTGYLGYLDSYPPFIQQEPRITTNSGRTDKKFSKPLAFFQKKEYNTNIDKKREEWEQIPLFKHICQKKEETIWQI